MLRGLIGNRLRRAYKHDCNWVLLDEVFVSSMTLLFTGHFAYE